MIVKSIIPSMKIKAMHKPKVLAAPLLKRSWCNIPILVTVVELSAWILSVETAKVLTSPFVHSKNGEYDNACNQGSQDTRIGPAPRVVAQTQTNKKQREAGSELAWERENVG